MKIRNGNPETLPGCFRLDTPLATSQFPKESEQPSLIVSTRRDIRAASA